MTNHELSWDIFKTLNDKGADLGNFAISIIEKILDNVSCNNCRFQSDTGEFEQCDQCRRNPVLKDFYEQREVER